MILMTHLVAGHGCILYDRKVSLRSGIKFNFCQLLAHKLVTYNLSSII